MTVIQAAGDLSGDGRMDLLARNGQGVLSLYAGDGKGGFAWRKTIGTGWNGMRSFAGMGDLTGDRHDDVLVSDSTGRLWLYPGNGRSGFAARKQLGGSNWLTFPTLIGTGDLVGDSRPDLIGAQRGDDVGTVRIFSGQPGATLLDIGAFESLEHGDLLR
jgi:hypothetical protein